MKTRWKTGVATGALSIVAMALAPFLYARLETAWLWHDVIGVDVSHHNGDVDWRSLAANGVAFAYIKATEGGDFRDVRFHKNWYGAKGAGVPRGAYHFFTQCRSGPDQAANFIRTVPKEARVLPPAVDAEHMGPCPAGQSIADIRGEILTFMDIVEAHYGKRPVVYTTREFEQAYLDGYLDTEKFGYVVSFCRHRFENKAGCSGSSITTACGPAFLARLISTLFAVQQAISQPSHTEAEYAPELRARRADAARSLLTTSRI